MSEIKSCEFDDDNLTVNVVFSDNKKVTILVTSIEESLDLSLSMQSKFDWLLYNEPSTFAELVLTGQMDQFLNDYGKSYSKQEKIIQEQLEVTFSKETAREIAREFMMYES